MLGLRWPLIGYDLPIDSFTMVVTNFESTLKKSGTILADRLRY